MNFLKITRKTLFVLLMLNDLVIAQTPIGSEVQVNTESTNHQYEPIISSGGNGNYIVVWTSIGQDEPTGSSEGVYAQLFDENDMPLNTEFLVNGITTSGQQYRPAVAMNVDGSFIITWTSLMPASDEDVLMKLFDLNGNAISGPTTVNTNLGFNQSNSEISMDKNGNYAITWVTFGFASGDDVLLQTYDSTGVPISGEIVVNQTTTDQQTQMNISVSENGIVAVVWMSNNQDGDQQGVYCRLFDLQGNALSNEFLVNSFTGNSQHSPKVSFAPNDNFIVVWTSINQDSSASSIYAQIFNQTGSPIGSEFKVNTEISNGQQGRSFISTDTLSNFLIAWDSDIEDGSGNAVIAQIFDSTGSKRGSSFIVNTFTNLDQEDATTTFHENGDFTICWVSENQDGDGAGVYAQRYSLDNLTTSIPVETSDFSVYPNPAKNIVQLNAENLKELKVYSMDGNPIPQSRIGTTHDEAIVDLSGLPAGFYLIKIINTKNQYFYKKVILN